jgi:hypothetical protein
MLPAESKARAGRAERAKPASAQALRRSRSTRSAAGVNRRSACVNPPGGRAGPRSELTRPRASRRIDPMRNPGAWSPRLFALALATLLAAAPAAADLWRWIDADGVPRYTPDPGRVPAAQRSSLVRVEPGMAEAPRSSPAPAPAIFAPPGDTLAADPFNAPERAREMVGEVVVEVPSAASAPEPDAPAAPPVSAAPLPPVDLPPPGIPPQAPPSPAPEAASTLAPQAEPGPAPEPAPGAAAPARAASSSQTEARRAELLAAIARDEEILKTHVSSQAGGPLASSAELREIAERLPALQAELRALEAQTGAP